MCISHDTMEHPAPFEERNIDCVSAALILSYLTRRRSHVRGRSTAEGEGGEHEGEEANERQEGKRLANSQACWTPRPGEKKSEQKGENVLDRLEGGWKIIATIWDQVPISRPMWNIAARPRCFACFFACCTYILSRISPSSAIRRKSFSNMQKSREGLTW